MTKTELLATLNALLSELGYPEMTEKTAARRCRGVMKSNIEMYLKEKKERGL
jgi:Cft2 family RNA processing exonuclease